jgi:TonB family protein
MFTALPPAAISVPAPPVAQRTVTILSFDAVATCGGQQLPSDALVRPRSVVATRFGPSPQAAAQDKYRYSFAIGADGRARTIRRDPVALYAGYYNDTSDLAPSLAASRFATGMPQADCSVTYTARSLPIEAAPAQLLYELASLPDAGSAPELWDRLRPAGSDCGRGPGQYRRLNLPAFERLDQAPGTSSWTFLAFDVDPSGRPRNVRTLASAGNGQLDRMGIRALSDNRYAPGPGYRGCTYHFHRIGPGTSPTASPSLPSDAPADSGDLRGCVVDPKSIAGLLGGSAFPNAFLRRRIAGVAVVSYDTAPWGALGNVKVVAAEPDEAFGEAARAALSNARVSESDTGRRGCVRRIRFQPPPE